MSGLYIAQNGMAARRGEVPSLNGLRAISIIIVVLSHGILGEFSKLLPGGLGVYIFFVISGFLITRLLLVEQKARGTISLPLFYTRRLLRLYPVIIMFSIVIVVLYACLGRPVNLLEPASALGYFANYYFLHLDVNNLPITMYPFDVFWSLSVEEHFYLVFPVTFLLLRGETTQLLRVFISLCIGCLWLRLTMRWLHPGMVGFYSLTQYRLDSIGFGVILALLCESQKGRDFLLRIARPVPAVVAVITILVCLGVRSPWFRDTLRYTVQGAAISVLVAAIVFGRYAFIQRVLNAPIMDWIGRLSYSLYVWHEGVEFLLPTSELPLWLRAAINLIASFAVATLSFYALEQPFNRLRKYFHPDQPSAAERMMISGRQ